MPIMVMQPGRFSQLPNANLISRYIAGVGVTSSGGRITQWNDQVGTAHMTDNATGYGPAESTDWLGRPVVRYDASLTNKPRMMAAGLSGWNSRTRSFVIISRDSWFNTTHYYIRPAGLAGAALHLSGTVNEPPNVLVNASGGTPAMRPVSLPRIQIVASSASSVVVSNEETSSTFTALPSATYDGYQIGAQSDGNFSISGDIYEVLVYDTTTPDVTGLRGYATGRYGIPTRRTKNLVFDGDSITQGTGVITVDNYPYRVLRAGFSSDWRMADVGRGGLKVADLVTHGAKTDAHYDPSCTRNVLVLLIGRNDITDGTATATIYSSIVSLLQARVAAGWEVWACTLIDSSTAGASTAIQALNQMLRGVTANGVITDAGVDRLIDFGAQPNLNPGSAPDPAYWQDALHLNGAGAQIMADLIYAQF